MTSPLRRSSRTPATTVHYAQTSSVKLAVEKKTRQEAQEPRKRRSNGDQEPSAKQPKNERGRSEKKSRSTDSGVKEEVKIEPPVNEIVENQNVAAMIEANRANDMMKRDELPSINDQAALNNFFDNNRARAYRRGPLVGGEPVESLPVNVYEAARLAMLGVGANSQEMSVKEALALNFRNYKVRISKKKIAEQQTIMLNATVNQQSPPPPPDPETPGVAFRQPISNVANLALQEMLNNLNHQNQNIENMVAAEQNVVDGSVPDVNNVPDYWELVRSLTEAATAKTVDYEQNNDVNTPEEPVAEVAKQPTSSPNVYPFLPFWKYEYDVSRPSKGIWYINEQKYVKMTSCRMMMHHGEFVANMEQPLKLDCNGKIIELSLHDLFVANGIIINEASDCKEIQGIFNSSGFLVLTEIAEALGGANVASSSKTESPEAQSIMLNTYVPPFACTNLAFFREALGKSFGPNYVYDCTTDNKVEPRSADVKKEDNKTFVPLVRLIIHTAYTLGFTIDDLATKHGVSVEDIKQAIENHEESARENANQYLREVEQNERNEGMMEVLSGLSTDDIRIRRRNKVRKTSFVGLNILVWRYFKECRDQGVPLSGKLLKEHAMLMSRQLGLTAFKGSEGWLDAFKRRHKIDLKTMAGVAVNYDDVDENEKFEDEEANDEANGQHDDMTMSGRMNANGEGITAGLLGCVEQASGATASISVTQPLDIMNFLAEQAASTSSGIMQPQPQITQSIPSVAQQPVSSYHVAISEQNFLANVVRSSITHIPEDPAVAHAMEVMRAYVLTTKPHALEALVNLQIELSKNPPDQNMLVNGNVSNGMIQ